MTHQLLALCAGFTLLGCGSVVSSECATSGKSTAQLQIEVPATYATAELVIRGDCQKFACATQSSGGCVLWEGEISTEGSAACQVTLYANDKLVESTRVVGSEACLTGTKRVVLGDE